MSPCPPSKLALPTSSAPATCPSSHLSAEHCAGQKETVVSPYLLQSSPDLFAISLVRSSEAPEAGGGGKCSSVVPFISLNTDSAFPGHCCSRGARTSLLSLSCFANGRSQELLEKPLTDTKSPGLGQPRDVSPRRQPELGHDWFSGYR